MAENPSTLLLCARVKPGDEAGFAQWQAEWQTAALAAGAESVEFWPPAPPDQFEWVAVAVFASDDALRRWRRGEENHDLVEQVAPLVEGGVVMQLVGAGGSRLLGQARRDHGHRHRHQTRTRG